MPYGGNSLWYIRARKCKVYISKTQYDTLRTLVGGLLQLAYMTVSFLICLSQPDSEELWQCMTCGSCALSIKPVLEAGLNPPQVECVMKVLCFDNPYARTPDTVML